MSDFRPGPVVRGGSDELECIEDASVLKVEACALPFELPKNFREMDQEEKDEVCKKLAEHNATENERDTAESNPSTILFTKPDGYQEFLTAKKLRLSMMKDEGEPIIVAKESPEMFAQTLGVRSPVSPHPPMPREGGDAEDCETLTI